MPKNKMQNTDIAFLTHRQLIKTIISDRDATKYEPSLKTEFVLHPEKVNVRVAHHYCLLVLYLNKIILIMKILLGIKLELTVWELGELTA